jgi:hypothetical protein
MPSFRVPSTCGGAWGLITKNKGGSFDKSRLGRALRVSGERGEPRAVHDAWQGSGGGGDGAADPNHSSHTQKQGSTDRPTSPRPYGVCTLMPVVMIAAAALLARVPLSVYIQGGGTDRRDDEMIWQAHDPTATAK